MTISTRKKFTHTHTHTHHNKIITYTHTIYCIGECNQTRAPTIWLICSQDKISILGDNLQASLSHITLIINYVDTESSHTVQLLNNARSQSYFSEQHNYFVDKVYFHESSASFGIFVIPQGFKVYL